MLFVNGESTTRKARSVVVLVRNWSDSGSEMLSLRVVKLFVAWAKNSTVE